MKLGLIVASYEDDVQYLKPLSFGYLAAYLKKRNIPCEVVVREKLSDLLSENPDIFGISSVSQNFGLAMRMAKEIRNSFKGPLLLGGIHITALPHTLPDCFDIGIIGEGEETLCDILNLYLKNGKFCTKQIESIPGIAFHSSQQVIVTEPRKLISDLDSVPFPDRDVLRYEGEPAYMFTSRGCPYRCCFCSSTRHWKIYRSHSPEYVVNEIEYLVRHYGTNSIHFFDDLFIANRVRLKEIIRLIKERGLDKKVVFSCAIRAEKTDDEICSLLKSANFSRVTFGAESNSDRILKFLKGETITAEDNQKAVDCCYRHGFRVGLSFIKGSPQETREDILKTYDFIIKNVRQKKIDQAEINELNPFPGTPIWEYAKKRGLVHDFMNWDELRKPWERQYMNETMPIEEYHKFNVITLKALHYLEIFKKKILVVVVHPQEDTLIEIGSAKLPDLFLFLLGDKEDEKLVSDRGKPQFAEFCTLKGVNLQQVAKFAGDSQSKIIALLEGNTPSIDMAELERMIWYHFENSLDCTLKRVDRKVYPSVFSLPFLKYLAKNYDLSGEKSLWSSSSGLNDLSFPGKFQIGTYEEGKDIYSMAGISYAEKILMSLTESEVRRQMQQTASDERKEDAT